MTRSAVKHVSVALGGGRYRTFAPGEEVTGEGAELVTNPKAFEGEGEVVGGAGGAGEDDGSEEESDEESEVQNNPEANEVETVLSELTLPELREEARRAGISTAGNKADLVERLGRR